MPTIVYIKGDDEPKRLNGSPAEIKKVLDDKYSQVRNFAARARGDVSTVLSMAENQITDQDNRKVFANLMLKSNPIGSVRDKIKSFMDYKTFDLPEGAKQITPGDIASLGLSVSPGIGDLQSGAEALQYAEEGRPAMSALAGVGALPFIPSVAGMAKVFHGSPHSFDKFDMNKIGTGEGAQAYGHGLYFAEKESVAKGYADNLLLPGWSDNLRVKSDADEYIVTKIKSYEDEVGASPDKSTIKEWMDQDRTYDGYNYRGEEIPSDDVEDALTQIYASYPEGNLYTVDIPDEAIPKMLDWDKPLRDQTPEVRDAINRAGRDPGNYGVDKITDDMQMIEVKKLLNSPEGVQRLKDMGIPGIRYLDGSSRARGTGTSNYVLFDDQMPRIIEKNGKPTGLLPYADDPVK